MMPMMPFAISARMTSRGTSLTVGIFGFPCRLDWITWKVHVSPTDFGDPGFACEAGLVLDVYIRCLQYRHLRKA